MYINESNNDMINFSILTHLLFVCLIQPKSENHHFCSFIQISINSISVALYDDYLRSCRIRICSDFHS